jgi:hypothetical protein
MSPHMFDLLGSRDGAIAVGRDFKSKTTNSRPLIETVERGTSRVGALIYKTACSLHINKVRIDAVSR